MFSIETYRKKETAVILKRIDQLPQNSNRNYRGGQNLPSPGHTNLQKPGLFRVNVCTNSHRLVREP